jgi:large subunit ribosomal protein L32
MAKHPVPKKKTSKARGNRRYKSFQNKARTRLAENVHLSTCPKCGEAVRMHHACAACGFYGEKKVLGVSAAAPVKEEAKVKTIKAE